MSRLLQLPLDLVVSGQQSLETFVWESSNQALQHFWHSPHVDSAQFVWLWGRAGVGKSHLLHAKTLTNPEFIYLPAKHLLQYDASELASLHDNRYLLLDDMHLFCGIAAWEEQLFNLCQLCLAQQGSLWFSADAAPAQLPWALKDLQSRLQLALIYEVHELSDAGKLQALARQAAQRGIELKEDCAQYLLARHPRQMHELMAVLDKLDTHALAEQRKLTIPFIKSVLGW